MALTYTYANGQISDYVLKRIDGDCKKDSDHTIMVGVFCKQCPFYQGISGNYVICEYHKEDDPGVTDERYNIYKNLQRDALCALDQ